MATEFDIAVGVLNRAEIKKLEKDIDDLEKKIVDVGDAFEKKSLPIENFNASIRVNGQRIAEARTKIQELTEENIRLGESIESGANPSMRTAIRVMDQLAMGSEGLIRSIPSLAQQFGATSELTIGLGAAALAVDLFVKNWKELKDVVGATDMSHLETQFSNLGEAASRFLLGISARDTIAAYKDIQESRKESARRTKEAEEEKESSRKSRTSEEKDIGADITEIMAEYGEERLHSELMARMKASGSKRTKEQMEEDAWLAIRAAKSGKFVPGQLGFGFERARQEFLTARGEGITDKAMIEADAKLTHELEEQGRENEQEGERKRRADEKADRDRIDMLEKQGRQNEEFGRMQLEDEKKQLERQKRDMIEAAHEMQTPRMFESTASMLKAMQTAILGDVAKDQLREAKLLNQKIDKVNDQLGNLKLARLAP